MNDISINMERKKASSIMKELVLNSAARTPINWLPLVLPLPSKIHSIIP
jgi:hypothetical protein